jgi:hypothetical protein
MGTAPFDAGDHPTDSTAGGVRKIKAAMAWLASAMGGKEQPAAAMESAALAAGHAHSTLAAARRRLHIRSVRRGNAWYWIPPKAQRSQSSAKVLEPSKIQASL